MLDMPSNQKAETQPAYARLETMFRRLYALREAAGVLHWDMSTMMPAGGAAARSEQLAALEVVCHEMLATPAVADLLEQAESEASTLDDWQRANLREMRREWRHANALESGLVEALAKASKRCETIWRSARAASDFKAVLPSLESLLALVRQSATAKAEAFGCEPYEALLDEYEPGASSARVDGLFAELADFLPEFLGEVLERQKSAQAPLRPHGPFPQPMQEALAKRLMAALGFNFDHGRLDVSLHPFCGGVPEDLRITTRYDEDDWTKALMGVLHETGHALYEHGLPQQWRLQPVGQARGMALHESQSLLIEMQACRSPDFVRFLAPLAREAFDGQGAEWAVENLTGLYHRVEPGFIRVDADEVTYPAHVVLRHRLERAMIAGDLAPRDLPGAWNEGFAELLGLTPPDDRIGCLQDIHWYDGAWGYFPTYTLGALAAAQLFESAVKERPQIPGAIGRGDFSGLLDWLGAKVHAKGARLSTDELLAEVTGQPLSTAPFQRHLKARYLS